MDNTMDIYNEISTKINEYLKTNKTEEVLKIYKDNLDFFKNYGGKIIFVSRKIKNKNLQIFDLFKGYEKYLKFPFENENLIFLNPKIMKNHSLGLDANFKIDWTISLDSNFASLIEKYLTHKNVESKNDVFKKITDLLSSKNMNIDYSPYVLENLFKSNVEKDSILSNVKRIIRLFNLDINSADNILEMKILDEEKYLNEVDKANKFINSKKAEGNDVKEFYNIYYLILLKIVYFEKKLPTTNEKIKSLVEFMDSKLNRIYLRELAVAMKYFKKETGLKFFNKLNNKNPDQLLKYIKNMAWDFVLSRVFLENAITVLPDPEVADFFIPYFLTLDEGLSEIIDIYRLKGIMYFDKHYEMQTFSDINEDNISEVNGLSDYFTAYAKNNRQKRLLSICNDHQNSIIMDIIKTTEQDIRKLLS
jgi:hypothetical protein